MSRATIVCLCAVLVTGFATARADPPWRIVKVADRDYLTVANIADFYQLPLESGAGAADRDTVYGDGRSSLAVGASTRLIEINGVKQYLSFPMLHQDGQTLVSRFDLAKTVEPCLRPTMIANLPPFHTVVLDAGHGGADGGVGSVQGLEKDYTLAVVLEVRSSLEARGFKVVTTREADVYLPLEQRAARANDVPDAIFVSVHFNASPTGDAANGFEVFAMSPQGAASTGDNAVSLEQFARLPGNGDDNASLALATCVDHSLLGHIPEADRGVKRARFAVLKLTRAPAILVEGGFLTNAADRREITDTVWRQKLARAIAQGIQSFQDLANRRVPPKLVADYRSEQLPLNATLINPAALALNHPVSAVPVRPVANPGLAAAPGVGADAVPEVR